MPIACGRLLGLAGLLPVGGDAGVAGAAALQFEGVVIFEGDPIAAARRGRVRRSSR